VWIFVLTRFTRVCGLAFAGSFWPRRVESSWVPNRKNRAGGNLPVLRTATSWVPLLDSGEWLNRSSPASGPGSADGTELCAEGCWRCMCGLGPVIALTPLRGWDAGDRKAFRDGRQLAAYGLRAFHPIRCAAAQGIMHANIRRGFQINELAVYPSNLSRAIQRWP
jgi:hypothetical protein